MEPLILPARRGGRNRSVNVREVLNGFSTYCGPAASGRRCPRTAAEEHGARRSRAMGRERTLEHIHNALCVEMWQREATSPTTAIIDSERQRHAKRRALLDPSARTT